MGGALLLICKSISMHCIFYIKFYNLRLIGQTSNTVLTKVAKGIANTTPQKPQQCPNNKTAITIATGCKLTALENNIGTNTLPSKI